MARTARQRMRGDASPRWYPAADSCMVRPGLLDAHTANTNAFPRAPLSLTRPHPGTWQHGARTCWKHRYVTYNVAGHRPLRVLRAEVAFACAPRFGCPAECRVPQRTREYFPTRCFHTRARAGIHSPFECHHSTRLHHPPSPPHLNLSPPHTAYPRYTSSSCPTLQSALSPGFSLSSP